MCVITEPMIQRLSHTLVFNMRNNRIRNTQSSPNQLNRGNDIMAPSFSSRKQMNLGDGLEKDSPLLKGQNMLHNMKVRFLLNNLIKKLRHLSPPHTPPPNIVQEWQIASEYQKQQTQKSTEYAKETLSEELSHRFDIFRHLNLVEGLLIVLFCWLVTVSIVFRENIGFQLFIVTMIISLARVAFLATFAIKEKDNEQASFLLDITEDFAPTILLSIACMLFAIKSAVSVSYGTYVIELIGVITVVFQYKQLQINFRNIVKYAQQSRMKKQLRIIELFMLIITLAHFFGLLLYATTYVTPEGQTSWITYFQLQDSSWHIKYIYCLYWAITTIVTVGYGDLTPKNYVEVLVVMIVQLIGTAVFGYMINVIGITVDEIKKKNEQFENYQQTIDKLRDHYQLSRQLCHKMKHDIKQKQNQFKSIPLKTTEEKDFLQYIQPNLKEEFVLETNMRVIKKSIFFLTHFSVNFQNQIALKLIRIIYKPDQEIPIFDSQLPEGQRSMVIVNSGSVNIFIEKHHNNLSFLKKVRQINPSQDALVMNVFGYSSLIMNRNIKLKAITNETAVSYVLRRKDILQCIQKSMLDSESFNEIRQKMIMFKFLEEVQAPTLKDNEWHYVPNIFLIQKKITYENQSRLFYYRSSMRMKLKIITSKNYQNKTLPKIQDDKNNMDDGQIRMNCIDDDFNSFVSISTNKIDSPAYFNLGQSENFLGKLVIDHCKVFQNFMKPSNLPVVAQNYQKSCQKRSYRKRIQTSVMVKPNFAQGLMGERGGKFERISKNKSLIKFNV